MSVASACDRWTMSPTTDSLEGTEGVIDHYSKDVGGPAYQSEVAFRLLEERLLTYAIFPPRLMRAQVCSDDGRIREGTTIVQRVALGPFALEAGVRVVRVWHNLDGDAEEVGFTYATLRGHPERGISTFRIRRSRQGRITFVIDVRSQSGSWLTRLTRPIARRYQRQATEAALVHFTCGDA